MPEGAENQTVGRDYGVTIPMPEHPARLLFEVDMSRMDTFVSVGAVRHDKGWSWRAVLYHDGTTTKLWPKEPKGLATRRMAIADAKDFLKHFRATPAASTPLPRFGCTVLPQCLSSEPPGPF